MFEIKILNGIFKKYFLSILRQINLRFSLNIQDLIILKIFSNMCEI